MLRRGGLAWPQYLVDAWQRWVLFWDTLRERGNNYLEHEQAGRPPLLALRLRDVDRRPQFERPVNYALVRIVPPKA